MLFFLILLSLLFVLSSAAESHRRIKYATKNKECRVEFTDNTLTLLTPIKEYNCHNGFAIAAEINIYEKRIDCSVWDGYRYFNFPQQHALMITKINPPSMNLEMLMRQYPNEHYFFIVQPPSPPSQKENDSMEVESEEDALISKFFTFKLN